MLVSIQLSVYTYGTKVPGFSFLVRLSGLRLAKTVPFGLLTKMTKSSKDRTTIGSKWLVLASKFMSAMLIVSAMLMPLVIFMLMKMGVGSMLALPQSLRRSQFLLIGQPLLLQQMVKFIISHH